MLKISNKIVGSVVLIISVALFTKFLNYALWDDSVWPKVSYSYSLLIGIIFLLNLSRISKMRDVNKPIILIISSWLLINLVANILLGDCNLSLGRENILMSLAFLSYFTFKLLGLTENQIMKIFTVTGLLILAIQVIQQFIPSFIYFGLLGDNEAGQEYSSQRNGISRFSVGSPFIAILCIYYYWIKTLTHFRIKYLLLFLAFLVSMYMYMTRQLMLATGITLALSVLVLPNKKLRWVGIFWGIVMVGFSLTYYDEIFGALVEDYQDNTYTTDIRQDASAFYILKMLNSPLRSIIGFGHSYFEIKMKNVGFYISDIGIIGETYLYGIIWIVIYLITLYKYLVTYRKVIPFYLRLFFIGTALDCVMYFPYRTSRDALIWLLVLYIGGIYVNRCKENLMLRRTNQLH